MCSDMMRKSCGTVSSRGVWLTRLSCEWTFSKHNLQKLVLSSPAPNCSDPKHSLHSNSANLPQTQHWRGAERTKMKFHLKYSSKQNFNFSMLRLHPSMTSVTSSTCDGKIRGYILKFLPNRGIWMIKHDGTSFNLMSDARKLCSNSCWTVGNESRSSFSTNNW